MLNAADAHGSNNVDSALEKLTHSAADNEALGFNNTVD